MARQNKQSGCVYKKRKYFHDYKKSKKKIKAFIEYNGPIEAPIAKDQELGKLKVLFNNELINTYPVYTLNDVKKVNLFSRIIKSINYLIWGDV